MGYASSIIGDIRGISEDSFELIREDLEEVFEEVTWENDNVEINSYGNRHMDKLEEAYSKIAFCMDRDFGELYARGDDSEDISVVFFAPGKWRQIWVEIEYPENPFRQRKQTLSIQYVKTAYVHTPDHMMEALQDEDLEGLAVGEYEFHIHRDHLLERFKDIKNQKLAEMIGTAMSEIDIDVRDICFCT